MTDNRDDPRGRAGRGRPDGPRSPRPGGDERGERPFRAKPAASKAGGFKTGASKAGASKRPPAGEDRPKRFTPDAERPPRRPRAPGDRPAWAGREDRERPSRPPRGAEDRPVRPRRDDDRPARPRRAPDAQADAAPVEPAEPVEERIAKVMARAGVASRRDAEAMIEAGRVTVNGETITSPALNVGPDARITVDGEPLPAKERTRLWLFHKPRGLVTTARDPEGRPTVFDSLPEDLPRVVAVGRLDINTEGLLLLTNDGGLAKVIAHPETGWLRRYRVRAHGDIDQGQLDALRNGISIDGMDYGPIEAVMDRAQGDNVWISMGLREGKNREIKRVLEHLGVRVNRLIRLSFGPFQLGDLEPGLVEEVKTRTLKDQLGERLAQEAGVDFESPVREPIAPFGTPAREPQAARSDRRGGGAERSERPPSSDRPRAERPRRFEEDRPRRGAEARPAREPAKEATGKQRKTAWRADPDPERTAPRPPPRRGADPKAARQVAGERQRERVGKVATAGGAVLVERLKAEPRPERTARPPRRPRPEGGEARGSDARPPRRFEDRGERPFRAGGDDRPRRFDAARPERREGPSRARREEGGERPPRRFEGERPRGPGAGPARFGAARPPRRFEEAGDRPRPSGGPNRAGPGRDGPSRSGPPRGRPPGGGPSRSGPKRGGPDRSGPDRSGPGRAGPGGGPRGPRRPRD